MSQVSCQTSAKRKFMLSIVIAILATNKHHLKCNKKSNQLKALTNQTTPAMQPIHQAECRNTLNKQK